MSNEDIVNEKEECGVNGGGGDLDLDKILKKRREIEICCILSGGLHL
jgi:hypothetical protein